MAVNVKTVFHVSAFSWHAFVVQSLAAKGREELPAGIFVYGGPWKYLTFLNLFVVLLFWSIFTYDRELVYPATIDTFFSPWMNHAMHTVVLPILMGEVLLELHTYPQTKHALAALGSVGVMYLLWIVWVYLSVGIWVYPLLRYFTVTSLYVIRDNLNTKLWGKDIEQMTVKLKS